MDRPFSDEDFSGDPSVRGPLKSPVDRTVRLFHATLTRSSDWTFTDRGALVRFGMLIRYVDADFICSLDNAALRQMALPGVAIPL